MLILIDIYSIEHSTKTTYFIFLTFKLTFQNNTLIVNLMQAKKVHLFVTSPFLLTAFSKHLGTEDNNCFESRVV